METLLPHLERLRQLANRVRLALPLLPQLGLRRVALNASHRLKLRTGRFRVTTPLASWPTGEWMGDPLFPAPRLEAVRSTMDLPTAIARGERILKGELPYFTESWRSRPPSWHQAPGASKPWPLVHWSLCHGETETHGDIKWVWEAARFDWLLDLARAWVASGDPRFVRFGVELVADWRRENAPSLGVHWRCGQECSLRLLNLLVAESLFQGAPCFGPQDRALFASTVAGLFDRIGPSLGYALSQNNNHGLSECAALYLACLRYPHLPGAARWRRRALRRFLGEMDRQFAPDGSYLLNSFNYHREALRLVTLMALVARHKGDAPLLRFAPTLTQGANFLRSFLDPAGRAPNYGPNDSTNLFSLSGAPLEDFRPAAQLALALGAGLRAFPSGAHDEELAWWGLSLDATGPAAPPPSEVAAPNGGYYRLTGGPATAFVRCTTHRTRPGHADMLHVDLHWGDRPLAVDGGTFQYSDPSGLGSHLKSTAAHNTVTVGNRSQMPELGNFLWGDWTRGRCLRNFRERGHRYWAGEHRGYERLPAKILHRRKIWGLPQGMIVVDDLLFGVGLPTPCELRWHLTPEATFAAVPHGVLRNDGVGLRVFCPGESSYSLLQDPSPYTARSRRYGEREYGWVVTLTTLRKRSHRLFTVVGPADWLDSLESVQRAVATLEGEAL